MTTTKVNSEFIAVNAISGTIIADGAITSTHLAANCVDSSELVTGSIDTIHIAANQVTSAKIVSDAVLTRHIADDQVTQALIAVNSVGINELAVTDGSNGQVLTTNGSGTLSFGTVSGTTINNNADNRIITGSGTANTLEGEANLIFDGTSLGVGTTSPTAYNSSDKLALYSTGNTSMVIAAGTSGESSVFMADGTSSTASYMGYLQYHHSDNHLRIGVNAIERMRIDSSGKVGIGTTSPAAKLQVEGTTNGVNLLIDDSTGWGVYVSAQNTLNFNYGKNSAVTGYINFAGYQAGYTQFRNLDISNGKQGSIAFFDGVNSRVGIGTTSPAVSLDVGSKTDAIKVPNGTDAQKPSGAAGMIRYNSTNSKLEGYVGSNWENIKTTPQDLTQISGLQVWADVTGGISSTTVADLSGNNRTGTLNSATTHKGTLSGNTYFEAFGSNTITYATGVLPNLPWSGSNACTIFFVCTNKRSNNTYATYLGSNQSAVNYQIIRHNGSSVNYNVYAENLSNWQITASNAVPVNATISEAYILIFQFKAPSGNSQVEIFKHENGSTTSATHAIAGNTYSFELTDNNTTVTIGTSSWSNEYLNAGIFAWGATNTEMSSADRQIIYDYYADKGLAN